MKEYKHPFKSASKTKIKTDVDQIRFDWDQADEQDYKGYIHRIKEGLTLISKGSPNWSNLGTRHKINALNGLYRNKLQRDEIIERYMNRDWVTAEEVKFIANTSKVTSQCIDKEMIQRTVSQANPEVIAQLEFEIAEKIINNYFSLKDKINTLRLRYLQKEASAKKQGIRLQFKKEQEDKAHQQLLESRPFLKRTFSMKLRYI
jgi:hypothetical protein